MVWSLGLGGKHVAQGQAVCAPQTAGVPEHCLVRGQPLQSEGGSHLIWPSTCSQTGGRVRDTGPSWAPPPHLLSLLWPLTPLQWMGLGVGHTEGRDSDSDDVVFIEVSHERQDASPHSLPAPPRSAGAVWYPLRALLGMLLDLHTRSSVRTSLSDGSQALGDFQVLL